LLDATTGSIDYNPSIADATVNDPTRDQVLSGVRRFDANQGQGVRGDLAKSGLAVTMNIGPLVLTNIGPPSGV
jgi:hypothetical protein